MRLHAIACFFSLFLRASFDFSLPVSSRSFLLSSPAVNMAKIKTIEYFRVLPRWLFVKVCDEQGNYGWGESTLEGHTLAVEGCLDSLRGRFVGYEAE